MEEDSPDQNLPLSIPSSSTSFNGGPSTSQVDEDDSVQIQDEDRQNLHQNLPQLQQNQTSVSYRLNISISDAMSSADMRDDVWSCLIVLVTFWFFASMTLILGFYGSANIQLGPNCSRLVQAQPFFVQSIKAEEIDEPKAGPMLYGFFKPPPLDVETTWTETHKTSVQVNLHKEWVYFLNEGSQVDISYVVNSAISAPLSLIIAQGKESLVEWIEDPSYPNTTLSWNIIHGKGHIQQEIFHSSYYYIAVGNLNSEEVEVELNITIKSLVYNTTQAYYKCSLSHRLCSLKLYLFRTNAAVLTSPGREQASTDDDWYIKLSYGPRWITYFLGSGSMTLIMLVAFRISNMFQANNEDGLRYQTDDIRSERAPLLSPKDDDLSSWGSYDSNSHDEEDLEACIAASSLEGKPHKEGETDRNTRRLCAICYDAPRDCFFLPCGHCATCFSCASRIVEEAGSCPICRRPMKKVRKIFTV